MRATAAGAIAAIRTALGVHDPTRVGYVSAHGTGTLLNDAMEAAALTATLPTAAVSGIKGAIGHTLGAAGALEAIFCLLMLDGDFITPSINVENMDPAINPGEVATDLVENAGLDTVMTNSFGFGGTNGSMLLSKYRG